MQLKLAIEAGPNAGQEFVFDRHDSFLVGRGPDAHFQLPTDDPYFSRRHFLIEINPPRCRLIDLNSRNGTLVNGERVNVAELKPGDEIKAGRTQLRLLAVTEDRVDTTNWPETGPAVPGPMFDQPPAVPGYNIVRQFGRGGMGVVYLAESTADGSPVAVKFNSTRHHPSEAAIQRFLREADILRQLAHPNIVGYRGNGEVDGVLYILMEYVPGTDAGTLLRKNGRWPVKTAVLEMCQVLRGLAYAHDKGFIYRDIKPDNILISDLPNGKKVVKLADNRARPLDMCEEGKGSCDCGGSAGIPGRHYRRSNWHQRQYA